MEKAPPGVGSMMAPRPEKAANCFWSRIAE